MKCSLLTLSCYLDGELEARRTGEVEAHLVGCERCRNGLGHLREEVSRIGALARVRVPDHSAHLMLAQIGLLPEDAALPDRGQPVDDVEAVDDVPWLAARSGAALPWSPRRPEAGVELRGNAVPPPAPPPPDAGVPALPFDIVSLHVGDPAPPITVDDEPAVEPAVAPPIDPITLWTSAPPAPPDIEAEEATTVPEAEEPPHPASLRMSELTAPEAGLIPAAPPPAPPSPSLTGPEPAPAPAAPVLDGLPIDVLPPPPPPDTAHVPLVAPGDLDSDLRALRRSLAEPQPAADLPTADVPDAPGVDAVAPHDTASAEGEPPVALRTPPDLDTAPLYPMTDDDLVDSEPIERYVGGPVPAARVTFLDRIRDRLAMRRTLSRRSLDVDADDAVEIVSGPGAPLHAGRSRAELARRRSEALRPPSQGGTPAVPISEPPLRTQLPPPARPSQDWTGGLFDGIDESDQVIAARGAVAPGGYRPAVPARPAAPPAPLDDDLDDLIPAAAAATTEPRVEAKPPLPPYKPPARRRPRPSMGALRGAVRSADPDSRRRLAMYGLAVAALFVVGVASARTTRPITPTPTSGPTATSGTHASSPAAPAAPVKPAPSTAPAPASAVPAPVSALSNVTTLGDSGTGWNLKDLRIGDHPGDLRIVLDLTPGAGATGTPRATVGLLDSTTLVVALEGTSGTPAAPALPGTATVTSITTAPASTVPGATIVYELKLARAVQVSAVYLSSPLRLVLDLR